MVCAWSWLTRVGCGAVAMAVIIFCVQMLRVMRLRDLRKELWEREVRHTV